MLFNHRLNVIFYSNNDSSQLSGTLLMINSHFKWQWLPFDSLSLQDLYKLLQLRESVFQLEQKALYQDLDNHDQSSHHCFSQVENQIAAYARVRIKKDETIAIERIIIAEAFRGKGMGKALVSECLRFIKAQYSETTIVISAQQRLIDFYQTFGFTCLGQPYDDAGLPHIKMALHFS